MLAFTAGVGEHSAVLRERICGALDWLGVQLDDDANHAHMPTISGARKPRPRRGGADQRGMDRPLARRRVIGEGLSVASRGADATPVH